MDGSHRTRAGGHRRQQGAHSLVPAPRHAAAERTSASHSSAHASSRLPTRPVRRPEPTLTRSARRRIEEQRHELARRQMMRRRRRSLGALSTLVLAVSVVIMLTRPGGGGPASAASQDPGRPDIPASVYTPSSASSLPAGAAAGGVTAADVVSPKITTLPAVRWLQAPGARIHCPVKVTACVDLKSKVTWLQKNGKIVLGPVRMQPGQGSQKTPRGTFTIDRKAQVYFSHTYGGAMPYSVFWGHDGIAYHEGTLTGYSHGCIHLSMANAKRFFAALHLGQRVYVA